MPEPDFVDESDPNSPNYRPRDLSIFGRTNDSGGPPLQTKVQDGQIFQLVKYGPGLEFWERIATAPDGPGGGGSSSSWSGQYINDALTAASQAIQAFLTGQSLADARKLASAEQFQSMAAMALPKEGAPPGYEEGGAAHQWAALQGQKSYTPPNIERRRVNPAGLAEAGQVPPEMMAFIDRILESAGKGTVVTTGGSSSG